jgi:hypothetical protein
MMSHKVIVCECCRERCVQGSNECKECGRRLCFSCFGDQDVLDGICDQCIERLSSEENAASRE